jgi:bla regulator protein blaR1
LLGKENSRARFAVWFCALLAVTGLPFTPSLAAGAGLTAQSTHSEIVLPGSWTIILLAIWATIAGMAAVRVGAGFAKVRQLRKSAVPVVLSKLDPSLKEIVEQFQSSRKVAVCSSSAVTVPTAIGFFQPMVLVPVWALEELSAEQLRVVLLHEFAHLQRWDDWTNLAQKLVRTVFFFHPAVWWIERRLSVEREMACDDVVVEKTRDPHAYARCLVSLAEKSVVRRGLAMAQAVVGHARETSARLARILDSSRPGKRVFKPALVMMTTIAALGFVMLPEAPKLIAFDNTARTSPSPVVMQAATVGPVSPVVVAAASKEAPRPSFAKKKRQRSVGTPIYQAARLNQSPASRSQMAKPVAVRASTDRMQARPQFLVVMQSAEYRADGSTLVRFSVWRVTFTNANRRVPQEGTRAKAL